MPLTGKQTSACASDLGDASRITCDILEYLVVCDIDCIVRY